MDYAFGQQLLHSFPNSAVHALLMEHQTFSPVVDSENSFTDLNHLLSNESLFIADGEGVMVHDGASTNAEMERWGMPHATSYTPPRSPAASVWMDYAHDTMPAPIDYLRGSSLEESPLSSPTHYDSLHEHIMNVAVEAPKPIQRSRSPLVQFHLTAGVQYESSEDEATIPEGVKLPQRKGGMQLWQFLYALLSNPESNELMQWTANRKEREFRFLEPEAIAIWWGYHKNKPKMSFDKLSRSLRYYYDKGIIRKIAGERYVYRFCIDPEVMYRHIGNSDSRPKLKPMPQAAKMALSKCQTEHNLDSSLQDSPYIVQAPESLQVSTSSPNTEFNSATVPNRPPPPYFLATSMANMAPVSQSEYLHSHLTGSRCNSFDNDYSRMSTSDPFAPALYSSASYGSLQTVDSYYSQDTIMAVSSREVPFAGRSSSPSSPSAPEACSAPIHITDSTFPTPSYSTSSYTAAENSVFFPTSNSMNLSAWSFSQ